jgi:ubiquinone/menaquinone biosynthesis C-methylase UbiE
MPLPSELYDRRYFLSDYCEGAAEFMNGRRMSALKAREVSLLGPRPGLRVLDAGCGRGEVLLACARRGAEVAGIDYAAAAVEIAGETLAGVDGAEVVRGSVDALPWPAARFDRVLCADVIEHLDPDQGERALAEMHRVLAPGGVLVMHTSPNRLFRRVTWPLARPVLRAAGHAEHVDGLDFWLSEALRYHINEQTLHGLRRALGRAGFRRPRVWLDPEVLRGGGHHLTRGLEASPLAGAAARLAGIRPLRLLLSNDLYAVAVREA